MTASEEHELKIGYINTMINKYDYLAFKKFCFDNEITVTPFVVFANIVEPMASSQGVITTTPAPCNTCGGGKVR